MKRTIICFGDSNTYGYDPRLGGEGRYPENIRWTELLKIQTQCPVENYGLCGRTIPYTASQIQLVCDQLQEWQTHRDTPIFICIMLGTNDLLQSNLSASKVALRMQYFLETVLRTTSIPDLQKNLLLIAPPQMQPGTWVNTPRLIEESKKLPSEYQKIAKHLGIHFADATQWNIPLSFDGVHYSEQGHPLFAQTLTQTL